MSKDAAILDSLKAPMLLVSTNKESPLEFTAAALRTKEGLERSWEFSATTLIDKYNMRSMSRSCSINLDATKGMQQINPIDCSTVSDTEDIVKKVIAVLKEKRNLELKCEYCNKSGHTIQPCFFNPHNPNNRVTPKNERGDVKLLECQVIFRLKLKV